MVNTDEDRFAVQVLGPITVVAPDGPVDPGGPKPRLLLALLLAASGHTVTTEQLIDGLWGEDPPATARKTVQVHVSNLRRKLGATFPLETSRAGYRIECDRLTVDAVEFERELGRSEAVLESDPGTAGEILAVALGRWRGPAYADIADEPAIQPRAARLTELRLRAVEQRIDAELRLGRHERVLGELETLTVDHPYRERLRTLQMLALYRSGRQTDALRAYDRTRHVLADQLGIDPGPELRQLHQLVLEQSPELDLISAPVTAAHASDAAIDVFSTLDAGVGIRGYELRERIGDRAGATVYRAYQPSVGREVALKVIRPDTANEPAFVKRFDASCRRIIELEHPHIVRLIDHWRDPSGAYVSMPLLLGGTLSRKIGAGPMAPPAGLQVIEQICAAIGHAHRRGIVHGDLRPSNVLLDEDGNAFVSDFLLDNETASPCPPDETSYLAPERRRHERPTAASDVFGIGQLACRGLAGVAPDDIEFAPTRMPSTFRAVIQRATEADPAHRYERVEHFARDLRRCFGADVVSTGTGVTEARNPYKGLRAFRESDASDFFGRAGLIDELIQQVRGHHLTVVVGPSGSGKSSLVHAGLLPAVRQGALGLGRDVVIAEMFPGAYPFDELATALLEVAVRRPEHLLDELAGDERGLTRAAKQILPDDDTDLLLIIDQFEELFVLTAEESSRKRFLDALTATAREAQRVRIVVTLRADFFGRPLGAPDFAALMRDSLVTVAPPGDDDLAAAISEPARRVGLEIEPGLIPTILRDVADEPGSLPMLQYALTELADQRDGDVLTLEAYRRTGGVVRAVATRAEEIYAGLPSAGRDAAKALFVRLVALSDEADDTRRRVRRSEIDGLGLNPAALQSVIDAFGSFRLLAFDHDPITRGPTVEVAHEALIREWPRYLAWVDEQREDLHTERRLASAVAEWRESDHEAGLLISGVRLERYERWAETAQVSLTDDEQSFLERSRQQENARHRAETARRRRALTLLSTMALIALVAAVVAAVQRDRAHDQARTAEAQSQAAREAAVTADALRIEAENAARLEGARNLAGLALAATDPDLGVLLGLEAAEDLDGAGLTDDVVDGALYQTIFDHRIGRRIVPLTPWRDQADGAVDNPDRDDRTVARDPSGELVAIGTIWGDATIVADASTGDVIGRIGAGSGPVDPPFVASSWDVTTGDVLTGNVEGEILVWRPNGEVVESMRVGTRPVWPLYRDGRFLTVLEFSSSNIGPGIYDVVAFDRRTGQEAHRIPGPIDQVSFTSEHLVTEHGRMMLHDDSDGSFRVYDTRLWRDITPARWRPEGDPMRVDQVAIDPDGRHAWLSSGSELLHIDVDTGAVVARYATGIADPGFLEVSSDGDVVAVGGVGSPVVAVVDGASGQVASELSLTPAVSPSRWYDWSASWLSRRRLALGTIVWDPGRPGGSVVVGGISARPTTVGFGADGSLVIGDDQGRVDITSADGTSLEQIDAGAAGVTTVTSGDGSTAIIGGRTSVSVVDLATREIIATGPDGFVRPLGVTPDGSTMIVATALDDRQHVVALADARTGELIARIGSLIDGSPAAVTSDGAMAAVPVTRVKRSSTEPSNSAVWLVDLSSGRVIRRGPPQECIVAAAFSSDDRLVATVGCDGNVSLFDAELLAGPASPTSRIGGTTAVRAAGIGVAFGPDDDEVIVTRVDGTVTSYRVDGFARAWQFDVGDHVGAPTVHQRKLWLPTSGWSADLASSNGAVVALPFDHDALVTMARATATRRLADSECEQYLAERPCSAG